MGKLSLSFIVTILSLVWICNPVFAQSEPSLDDLWKDRAEFRSEEPNFVAMSVNLRGSRNHSGAGKLSINHLKDGRFIGVYNVGHNPFSYMSFSTDGINFHGERPIEIYTQWDTILQDTCVLVFDLHGEEHIFLFSETPRRNDWKDIGVNTAIAWSTDLGRTWSSQRVPLTESRDIPDWGKSRFRGTSVPSAVMHMDRKHLWVYWTGLYGSTPNHSEIGVGFIAGVDPDNPSEWLPINEGGTLETRNPRPDEQGTGPIFVFTIDPPQRTEPVIKRGQHDWCNGGLDIGGIALGDDGIYYAPIVGGRFSEGECDDTFDCGIARTTGMTSWELRAEPILSAQPYPSELQTCDAPECQEDYEGDFGCHAHGRRNGISYPQIVKIGSSWYLYYVVDNGNFDGSGEHMSKVPNPKESHARLKLQWKN